MAAAKAVKDAADERRRDEAAAVLAPIKALVIDADPVRLTMSDALQHWENDMPRLVEEWRRGREALLKLSISHPLCICESLPKSAKRRCTDQCQPPRCIIADTLRGTTTTRNLYDQARKEHDEAAAYVERLAEAISASSSRFRWEDLAMVEWSRTPNFYGEQEGDFCTVIRGDEQVAVDAALLFGVTH